MKKVVCFLILCILFFAVLPVDFANANLNESNVVAFKGKGSKSNPYLIERKEDLINLSLSVESGKEYKNNYFKQTADIDLTGVNFKPIGQFGKGSYFKGIYNGHGFRILNINIEDDGKNNGLFGYLEGIVINLGLEGGYIGGSCVGSIASHGSDKAKIVNCYSTVFVYGSARAGGLADNFGGIIVNSFYFNKKCDAPLCSYNALNIAYCFSTYAIISDNINLSTIECRVVEECDFVKKLNDNIYVSATIADISFKEFKSFEKFNNGIRFTTNNQKFHLKDKIKTELNVYGFKHFRNLIVIICSFGVLTAVIFRIKNKEITF